jgi:DeoR/GlpR family transcriptional regulator of sugar metabolism
MKLIEINKAAHRLAVSESTVRRMLRDPESPLRAVRVYKGALRVLEDSIDDVLRLNLEEKTFQE